MRIVSRPLSPRLSESIRPKRPAFASADRGRHASTVPPRSADVTAARFCGGRARGVD